MNAASKDAKAEAAPIRPHFEWVQVVTTDPINNEALVFTHYPDWYVAQLGENNNAEVREIDYIRDASYREYFAVYTIGRGVGRKQNRRNSVKRYFHRFETPLGQKVVIVKFSDQFMNRPVDLIEVPFINRKYKNIST